MFQIRIHGRGGQGVVTAAEVLSIAAFLEGQYALAFPTFGSERMGAPVTAFCRISDSIIRLREPVVAPDALIVQDATLLHNVPVFAGLVDSGYLLINSSKSFEELGIGEFVGRLQRDHCQTVPASRIALKNVGRPIPNAALLGAFAAMTRLLNIDSVVAAIMNKFPGRVGENNAAAARAACSLVMERTAEYATAT
jgi:pyruvate ferredoxin oxidoreductase gamma subunit